MNFFRPRLREKLVEFVGGELVAGDVEAACEDGLEAAEGADGEFYPIGSRATEGDVGMGDGAFADGVGAVVDEDPPLAALGVPEVELVTDVLALCAVGAEGVAHLGEYFVGAGGVGLDGAIGGGGGMGVMRGGVEGKEREQGEEGEQEPSGHNADSAGRRRGSMRKMGDCGNRKEFNRKGHKGRCLHGGGYRAATENVELPVILGGDFGRGLLVGGGYGRVLGDVGHFRDGPFVVLFFGDAVGDADAEAFAHVFLEGNPFALVLNAPGPCAHGDEGVELADLHGAKGDAAEEEDVDGGDGDDEVAVELGAGLGGLDLAGHVAGFLVGE